MNQLMLAAGLMLAQAAAVAWATAAAADRTRDKDGEADVIDSPDKTAPRRIQGGGRTKARSEKGGAIGRAGAPG